MGVPSWDDIVLIEHGKNPGDPTVVTVNCPDKAGLGCDLCGIILEFGLYVTRGGLQLSLLPIFLDAMLLCDRNSVLHCGFVVVVYVLVQEL